MSAAWRQWQGQVVNGEFHLRQYLGGSDHSAVFLTQRGEREAQKAAIKLIAADPETVELQLSRWELAARLSHPHLVRLFQAGRCQLGSTRLLYVVMDYAEQDLSQILPHRPLTPAEALDMLQPVLDALGYVHGKGLVHARMKPSNIMAVADQIRVSSDGLCGLNQPGRPVGKPSAYDPPEAANGGISPAGDIWSLGVTLVEALTQRLPVWAGGEQGEPALPNTMPAPFQEIARHCLRREPQRRWTVADIAARLRPASNLAREETSAGRQKVLANWRYVLPLAAVVLVLAAVFAVPRHLNPPEAERVSADSLHFPNPQAKPEQGAAKPQAGYPTPPTGEPMQRPSVTAWQPAASGAGSKAPAGDVVRGAVVHQVLPDVPKKASDTIQGKVRVKVRVTVDPSGRVTEATLESPGPSKYFARLAMQAARGWTFTPAQVAGQAVASEWVLRFEFGRTSTQAFAAQATP